MRVCRPSWMPSTFVDLAAPRTDAYFSSSNHPSPEVSQMFDSSGAGFALSTIGMLIIAARRSIRQLIAAKVVPMDITPHEYRMLMILFKGAPMSLGELARAMGESAFAFLPDGLAAFALATFTASLRSGTGIPAISASSSMEMELPATAQWCRPESGSNRQVPSLDAW